MTQSTVTDERALRPGLRGWKGPGGGRSSYVHAPASWRGTSRQVCGLWPMASGSGSPIVGVPIGRHLISGATVCCDPLNWFLGHLIGNPSAWVQGLPGLGKSTLVRRWVLGLAGYGVTPMILGDLKPDYVDLITALGGQVIRVGPGRDAINVLDASEALAAADRLVGDARRQLLADASARRHAMVAALITIVRQGRLSDREETILDRAIAVLDERNTSPVLGDLLQVIRDAPDAVRQVAIDRGDMSRYQDITEGLEASLMALTAGGRLSELFCRQTTTPMLTDRPVVFDISSLGDDQKTLQAAVLMACWSYGFGTINVHNALADAGVIAQRHFFLVMDELWRAIRVGEGMVDRIDALTRLNRQRGVGQAFVTHSLRDLRSVSPEDQEKARGFAEKAGMVVAGGLPGAELELLNDVAQFSGAEQHLVRGWETPMSWHSSAGIAPGAGNFLLKVGAKPGIPIHVALTERERAVNDTNKRWAMPGRKEAVA